MKIYIVWDEQHGSYRAYPENLKEEAAADFITTVKRTFNEMGGRYCTEINGEKQAFDDRGRTAAQAIEFKSTVFGGHKIAFEEGELVDND